MHTVSRNSIDLVLNRSSSSSWFSYDSPYKVECQTQYKKSSIAPYHNCHKYSIEVPASLPVQHVKYTPGVASFPFDISHNNTRSRTFLHSLLVSLVLLPPLLSILDTISVLEDLSNLLECHVRGFREAEIDEY